MNYERSEASERKRRWVWDMKLLKDIEILESEEFWSQIAIDDADQERVRLQQLLLRQRSYADSDMADSSTDQDKWVKTAQQLN